MCDRLILQVKSSNLNFLLEESPFSVNISLKKTFIRKKNRDSSFPLGYANRINLHDRTTTNESLVEENIALKNSLKAIHSEKEALEDALSDMNRKLEKSKEEICELPSENNHKNKEYKILGKEADKICFHFHIYNTNFHLFKVNIHCLLHLLKVHQHHQELHLFYRVHQQPSINFQQSKQR